jgi:putative nucleotidyltransferase with HDIG domain
MWQFIQHIDWAHIEEQLPWFRELRETPQDPVYHAEGDVATHTRMVVEALQTLPEFAGLGEQDRQILLAAALLHDIEKRSTTVREPDGRITSRGHARKGAYTARTMIYRERPAPFAVREAVVKLVRYHGLPLWIMEKPSPEKALFQASLEVNTRHLYLLAKADVLGRICDDQEDLLYRVELFKAFCEEQTCWGIPRAFPSGLARYEYFQKEDRSAVYEPYDDTWGEVVLLSGLPGVGKDTFIGRHYADRPVVSLDNIRGELNIDPADSKANGRVVQEARERARVCLRRREPFVWNATSLTRLQRRRIIDLAADYGARVKVIYLEVPYEVLHRQNREREKMVPPAVIERMIDRLEVPSPVEAHGVVVRRPAGY